MRLEDLCFTDFETRAEDGARYPDDDVTASGAYRYTKNAFAIIKTFAIGSGPVQDRALDRFDGDWMLWRNMPDDLKRFYDRAAAGKAWFVAWNMNFDRQAWNNSTADFPLLTVDMTLDAMVQAAASNLPPKLEDASKFIGRGGKQQDGKALIRLFCSANGATPQQEREKWLRFISYGRQDIDELRAVWEATRPLPMAEWEEYWASEEINDTGMAVDVGFCERASAVAQAELARTNDLLRLYTNGRITAITQAKRIGEWLWDQIEYSEAREILVTEIVDEDKANGEEDIKTVKLSIARENIARLIAFYDNRPELSGTEETILKVLQLREFGASATPKKFDRIIETHDDGVLKGQFVLNGAQQTGRFSSRGVQVHNLNRSSLGKLEAEAIEMINDIELED